MAICALLVAIYLDRVSIHTEFAQELPSLVLSDLDHQGETPGELNNDLPCIQTKSIKPAILIHCECVSRNITGIENIALTKPKFFWWKLDTLRMCTRAYPRYISIY